MPRWNQILQNIQENGSHDVLRKKILRKIAALTKRNVMLYYSGWLQKPNMGVNFGIDDGDKNGFMACCPKKKDRTKGLDLILHTPGGSVDATESLIDYLYDLYQGDVRAFIPQLAMSGGTLIAVSCKEIVMGSHSSIGPVDPQINGIAAQSYIAEFRKACKEVKEDPSVFSVWQTVIGKLPPGFITECQNAIDWSNEILTESLKRVMFKDCDEKVQIRKIENVLKLLGDQEVSKTHSRHITRKKAQEAGLKVVALEDDNALQDLILSLHHLMCLTFQQTTSVKIFANDMGSVYINHANPILNK
ncbi:MAG: hypothetical protein NC211_09280 [Alistipes senegalensis]|nr:hypothetical protein [Oxalobacter formigenes]MCM1282000.1 hypothetical protein [Alistipes senegalensis]